MAPIRVLQIVPAMNCGGMESFIMNVYRCMDREKVQFDFLYHYQDHCFFDEEIRALGGKITKLSVRNDNNLLKYFRELNLFFKTHPEYRVIHGHYSGFGLFYNYFAQKNGVKVRAGHSHSDKYEKGLKGQLDRWLSKPFRFGLTHRFACSEAAGRFLFGKKEFVVLNNGIDAQKFSFDPQARDFKRREFGFAEDDFVVGHVGRFDPVKNHKFLLEAFAQAAEVRPELRLLLVGDGELRKSVEEYADRLGIASKVVFAGVCRDVNFCYSAMDCFVLPSLFEGIPLSAVEAQTNGLSIAASKAVNSACDVTGNVKFLELKQTEWVSYLKTVERFRDKESMKKVQAAGYDIRQTSAFLQNFYEQSAQ